MILLYIVLALLGLFALSIVVFIYLMPEKFISLLLEFTRKKSGLTCKKISIEEDLHISYLEGGSGECIVLLHGFGANKDIYVNFAEYLTPKYHVIIPDIIGFGDSSHPKDADYSPLEQAKRLHKFLQILNIPTAHFIGNSMGGQISVVYASNFPKNVRTLFLVSPAGLWTHPLSDIIKIIIDTKTNPLIARSVEEFKELMSLAMVNPPKLPKPLFNVLAKERINNADLEEKIFRALVDYSVENDLKNITQKTLILFGEYDKIIIPQIADKFEELLKSSLVVVLENTGHVATYEQPKLCADHYLKFIDDLS